MRFYWGEGAAFLSNRAIESGNLDYSCASVQAVYKCVKKPQVWWVGGEKVLPERCAMVIEEPRLCEIQREPRN